LDRALVSEEQTLRRISWWAPAASGLYFNPQLACLCTIPLHSAQSPLDAPRLPFCRLAAYRTDTPQFILYSSLAATHVFFSLYRLMRLSNVNATFCSNAYLSTRECIKRAYASRVHGISLCAPIDGKLAARSMLFR